MIEWHVEESWKEALHEAGIDDYRSALAYASGTPASRKSHSQTWRLATSRGTLFLKQDTSTQFKNILRSLIRFRKPLACTQKERRNMERLKDMGFNFAEVVAYGGKTRLGIPDTAVMVTCPVPGRAIEDIWADAGLPEARRQEARDLGLKTLARLQDLNCDWQRDCKPEHFFLTEDNRVFLIDVESMHFRRVPEKKRAMQTARFLKLLEKAEKRAQNP